MIDWQLVIMIGGLVIIGYWLYYRPKDVSKELLLAVAIALLWVTQSGLYGYREINYSLFGVNLFAFISWTTGLVIVKEWYESVNWKNKFIKFTLLYMVLMVAVEFIGYNFLGIKLVTHYEGIFGLEAMHMPIFGKIYYLIAGPLYIKLCEWLDIK